MNHTFKLKEGDRFKLTNESAQEYSELFGGEYANCIFEVTQWFQRYVPPSSGLSEHDHAHPDYDDSMLPQRLYRFKNALTGEESLFNVYDCEIVAA